MESGGGRSDPRPLTREEEAVKRNTDCVYFLASPLTCKKGSECEYRHSEGARVNPRDCKFWFSGNCLNPTCLFRHPPLDGPVGNPVATSGPIMTASLVTTSMQLPIANSSAYNVSRNNVPCYYFQKGTCLKGDKCPFMHGPQPAGNPVAKQTAKVSAPVTTQLETPKKDAWKLEECSNQQNLSTSPSLWKESAGKPVNGAPSSVVGSMALENANIHYVHKSSLLPLPTRNGLPRSQVIHVPVSSSTSLSRPPSLLPLPTRHHLNEREAGEILGEFSGVGYTELKRPLNHQLRSSRYQNDKGVEEEVFREFSPGFDVLVDNVVNVADYLHDIDGFRSVSIQGGRNVNHGDGYGHQHSGLESAAWLDGDRHNGADEFQHYGKVQNGGDGDRHRTFSVSERILDKPILPVRRSAHRLRSPDGMDESDLRHRLMKQRRLNSSLSATISGCESETYSRHEQKMQARHTHNSYRDQRQLLPESSISSRLRGRITLPKLSSPEFPSVLQGEVGRGRQRGKLSPVRPSSLQGRLGERSSRRPVEDRSGNTRNIGSQQKAIDGVDPLNFAGPRSLAELKGAKADESSQGQSTKNIHSISSLEHNGMKSLKAAGLRDSEVSVAAFDSPKPLSALMKRNREATPENDAIIFGVSNDRKAIGEIVGSCASDSAPVPELQSRDALEGSLEGTKAVVSNPPGLRTVVEEEGEVEEEEVHIPAEPEQICHEQQAVETETEARDAVEDEELDYTDQRDGEYDYETVEGGDYKTEDDENMDPMNVDVDDDDDDDDDFAKKIGLIYS